MTNHEQMIMSYESIAYAMNSTSEFYDLMIFIHFRNQASCFEIVISIILIVTT